jgi:hypothetical protein
MGSKAEVLPYLGWTVARRRVAAAGEVERTRRQERSNV